MRRRKRNEEEEEEEEEEDNGCDLDFIVSVKTMLYSLL